MKLLTFLDMLKNELRNAVVQNLASDPGTPTRGQIYYHTGNNRLMIHDNTAFRGLAALTDRVHDFAAPTASLAMNSQKITGLGAATAATDAASLANRLDQFAAPTAAVGLNSQRITGLGAGTAATDAASLSNRLDQFAAPTASVAMGNQKITGLANGTAATDAATYGQLMTTVNGFDWKSSVRVATTAALAITARTATTITLGGTTLTIDGVTLANGDSVLVKNATTGTGAGAHDNGIYTVGGIGTSVVLTRRGDADEAGEITANMTVAVEEGTANADSWWQNTTNGAVTIGTTALTFAQVGSGSTYTAGNGITLTGSAFSVTAHTGISVTASGVAVDTTVVPRKYSVNVGNGTNTSFTVTHNLSNANPIVQVYEAGATGERVWTDVTKVDANSVSVSFAVAPSTNAYTVVVFG